MCVQALTRHIHRPEVSYKTHKKEIRDLSRLMSERKQAPTHCLKLGKISLVQLNTKKNGAIS
jgi:hypothetical protein